MIRNTARDEQVRQNIHDIVRAQPVAHAQRKALPGVFINNRQYPDLRPVDQTVEHKVIRPHMILPARPQANAGAIIQVKTTAFLMSLWDFQALLPPDPLNPFVINPPALYTQQRRNPLISIPTIFCGKTDNVRSQGFFVVGSFNRFSKAAAVLPQRTAYLPLRIPKRLPRMNNGLNPPLRRGQNFPFEISFKIWLSTVRSATARLSRAFSDSRSFIRFA